MVEGGSNGGGRGGRLAATTTVSKHGPRLARVLKNTRTSRYTYSYMYSHARGAEVEEHEAIFHHFLRARCWDLDKSKASASKAQNSPGRAGARPTQSTREDSRSNCLNTFGLCAGQHAGTVQIGSHTLSQSSLSMPDAVTAIWWHLHVGAHQETSASPPVPPSLLGRARMLFWVRTQVELLCQILLVVGKVAI